MQKPLVVFLTVLTAVASAADNEDSKYPPNYKSEQKVILLTKFENSTQPYQGQAICSKPLQAVSFAPGLSGAGVLLGGTKKLSLTYRLNTVLNKGSYSFWFKPINWTSNDAKNYFIFSLVNGAKRLMFYKLPSPPAPLLFVQDMNSKKSLICRTEAAWNKGDFQHVVLCWDNSVCQLYLNCRLIASIKIPDPGLFPGWTHLCLGTFYTFWPKTGEGQTLYDELLVVPYVMTQEEVKTVYNQGVNSNETLKKKVEKKIMRKNWKSRNNLALSGFGSYALASSFSNYKSFYTDNLIDGEEETIWKAIDKSGPHWLEIRAPNPVKVNKINLVQTLQCVIIRGKALYWEEGKWKKAGIIDNKDKKPGEISSSFPEVEASRFRIIIEKASILRPELAELELYGPDDNFSKSKTPYWNAYYIWYPEKAYKINSPRYFRKSFNLTDHDFVNAILQSRSNDYFKIFINGSEVSRGSIGIKPYSVGNYLHGGRNVIAAVADLKAPANAPGVGSFISELSIAYPGKSVYIGTDAEWKCSDHEIPGWENPGFDDSKWPAPVVFAKPPNNFLGKIRYAANYVREKILLKKYTVTPKSIKPGQKIKFSAELESIKPLVQDYCFLLQAGEEPDHIVSSRIATVDKSAGKFILEAELYLPDYTPGGNVPLNISATNKERGVQLEFIVPEHLSRPMVRVEKSPSPPVNGKCNLDYSSNTPALNIDGEKQVPYFSNLHCPTTPERFYSYTSFGTKVISLHLMKRLVGLSFDHLHEQMAKMDRSIRFFLSVVPDGFITIWIDLRPSTAWMDANPSELLVDVFGNYGPVSYSSGKFYQDSQATLTEFLRILKEKPYYNRVVGFHPDSWGISDSGIGGVGNNTWQSDRNKITIGDYNPQSIKLFREFLKKRYQNVKALQKAWKRPTVTFENAAPDINELRRAPLDGGVFRDPANGRMLMDYAEFLPRVHANYYRKIASFLKSKCPDKLIRIFYGYTLGHLRSYNTPGHQIQNSNFSFNELLEDKNIDVFMGAPEYSYRLSGQPYTIMWPAASVVLHKKLYAADGDYRTFVASPIRWGRQRSEKETCAVLRKDIAFSINNRIGAWFSGSAGTGGRSGHPWFVEKSIRETIKESLDLYQKTIDEKSWSPTTEIAVLIQTRQPWYSDIYYTPPLMHNLIKRTVYDSLNYLGTPYDLYMMDDLTNPEIRKDYKLYIMLNAFVLTDTEREAINNLKRDGNTILWMYAPDYIHPENGLSTAGIGKITGINVAQKNDREQIKGIVSNIEHQITQKTEIGHKLECLPFSFERSRKLHPIEFKPVFYINDPQALILCKYQDGKAAMAVRDFGDWKSVYCAIPYLDGELIRGVARYADVHLYCNENMVMSASKRLLMLHNGYGKEKNVTVNLPEKVNISDAISKKTIITNSSSLNVKIRECETLLYRLDPLDVTPVR